MKVRFTRKAQADLDQIGTFISNDNEEAASRIVTRLMELAWALGDNPKEGRATDESGIFVLVAPRLHYLIFYRITVTELQIIHIRHTSRSQWRLSV
jgi:addiction module RelE/StbE family toxin